MRRTHDESRLLEPGGGQRVVDEADDHAHAFGALTGGDGEQLVGGWWVEVEVAADELDVLDRIPERQATTTLWCQLAAFPGRVDVR